MPCKLPKVPTRRLTLPSLMLFALVLSGCASLPRQATLTVPQTLREPCARAEAGSLATVGDLGALVIRQEAVVSCTETKRSALVGLIDAYADITKTKRWRLPWSKP